MTRIVFSLLITTLMLVQACSDCPTDPNADTRDHGNSFVLNGYVYEDELFAAASRFHVFAISGGSVGSMTVPGISKDESETFIATVRVESIQPGTYELEPAGQSYVQIEIERADEKLVLVSNSGTITIESWADSQFVKGTFNCTMGDLSNPLEEFIVASNGRFTT